MSAAGQHPVPAPCPRCTGYGDAHYLTCPTLRLRIPPAADRAFREMVALSEELGLYGEEVTVNATAARQSRYEHYDP